MKLVGKVLIGIVMLALLAVPARAFAQEGTPIPAASGTVTVLGNGKVQIKPDTATVQVGISVQQETLRGALDEANATMTRILESLAGLGIASDDIQTANFNVYAVRDFNKQAADVTQLPPLVGYNVTNQVSVTIRDLEWVSGLPSEQVGQVIEESIGAGANDIYGVSFSVEDTKVAEREARRMAVENAGERAAELADAAGKSVGDVIAISEGVTFTPIGFTAMADNGQRGGAGGAPIMGGTIEIMVDVSVTYQLV
jgi:uncharacterized protein YggE